jgi:hypothetical protein
MVRQTVLLACLGVLAGCANLPGVYKLPDPAPAGSAAPLPVAAIGAPAPDAVFFGTDGKRHVLSEYKGKFLALVFFAHW